MAMKEQGKLEAQHRGSVIFHLQCLSGCSFGPSFLLIIIDVSQQKGSTSLEQSAALPSATAVSAVHLKIVGLPSCKASTRLKFSSSFVASLLFKVVWSKSQRPFTSALPNVESGAVCTFLHKWGKFSGGRVCYLVAWEAHPSPISAPLGCNSACFPLQHCCTAQVQGGLCRKLCCILPSETQPSLCVLLYLQAGASNTGELASAFPVLFFPSWGHH